MYWLISCTPRDWLFVSFGSLLSTFLSWRLLYCIDFSLFLFFSKDRDLRPALWRQSLCFFSLMVFSWSSIFLFEGLWLMIFFTFFTFRSIYYITKVPYFSLHIELLFSSVLLLRNLLIISFLKLISVLRNSFFF